MTVLYNRMLNADLVIRIGESKLPCHKVILMSRSTYFDAMFTHEANCEFGKDEVTLHDVSEVDPTTIYKCQNWS